jgi:hypothetical protein
MAVERNDKEFAQLRDRLADVTEKYEKVKQDAKRMETILNKIDPKETARIKRKNKQYSQLFMIMKGQKELAEELSKNWELALKQTSAWIIKNHDSSMTVPERIGPLVGTALELIGGHLFDDSMLGVDSALAAHPETEQELDDLINEATAGHGKSSAMMDEEGMVMPLAAADDRGANLV